MARTLRKYFRYRVTHVWATKGRKPLVKVGDVLLYKTGRGKIHSTSIFKRGGSAVEEWGMEKIGVCWVSEATKKIVRSEER